MPPLCRGPRRRARSVQAATPAAQPSARRSNARPAAHPRRPEARAAVHRTARAAGVHRVDTVKAIDDRTFNQGRWNTTPARKTGGGDLDGAAGWPGRTPGVDGTSSTVRGWTANEIPSTPRPFLSVGSVLCGRDRCGADRERGPPRFPSRVHASSPQSVPVPPCRCRCWRRIVAPGFGDEGRRSVAAEEAASIRDRQCVSIAVSIVVCHQCIIS